MVHVVRRPGDGQLALHPLHLPHHLPLPRVHPPPSPRRVPVHQLQRLRCHPTSLPLLLAPPRPPPTTAVFVSINRFERKKNIQLALDAYALLPHPLPPPFTSTLLVLAGGYDPLNAENVAYVPYLESLCQSHSLRVSRYPDVTGDVCFLPSFSHSQRSALLSRALAILYTPQDEHFGIVPIEAMYARRVVIACDSGGPVESIDDGATGWLCAPRPERFVEAMVRVMQMSEEGRQEMGERGRERVKEKFGMDHFVGAFDQAITRLVEEKRARGGGDLLNSLMTAVAIAMMVIGLLLALWD